MHHTLSHTEDEIDRLERLHNQFFMSTPTNTPPVISMQPVESSQIHYIGYHPESQTLAVTFVNHKPAPGRGRDKKPVPGATYHYHGVTPEQHKALMDAPSKYSHFHENKATHFAKFTKLG